MWRSSDGQRECFQEALAVHSVVPAHCAGLIKPCRRFPIRALGRMAGKKAATLLVKLLSTAGTGYFYVAKKNPRKLPKKLEFVK